MIKKIICPKYSKSWNDQQIIEWLGWVKDVKKILLGIDVLCLPSYRGDFQSLC